ncbi:MAG: right-handed parallel beta-helix repeat-containing protein [Acidobacteriia bacterium]|nr:right-handed parallel beta-helix repeat-containing protein [Terriglobia bacterium]
MERRNYCFLTVAACLLVSGAPAQILPQITLTVNCAAGQKVGSILKALEVLPRPATVNIQGVCTEPVLITRDDLTLRGTTATDGLRLPPGSGTVLSIDGARRVVLNRMRLDGGAVGLAATGGASFTASDLLVTGGQRTGVSVTMNASGRLSSSTVENVSENALLVQSNGSLWISGSRVLNSVSNAGWVDQGGQLMLTEGTVVRNAGGSFNALTAREGGSITVDHATVECGSTAASGAYAFTGGTVVIAVGGLIQSCQGGWWWMGAVRNSVGGSPTTRGAFMSGTEAAS